MSDDAWASKQQRTFFRLIFGENSGFVCIATLEPNVRSLHERYFMYPNDLEGMLSFIAENSEGNNVYYCPQLLTEKRRKKETVKYCPNIWADLDDCAPEKLLVKPSVLVESSPGRHQALWKLEDPAEPQTGESLARRIHYFHSGDGADKSGWDLTQLLRVPLTNNLKYAEEFPITLVDVNRSNFRPDDFRAYPETFVRTGVEIPMPGPDVMGPIMAQNADDWMAVNKRSITVEVADLYYTVPTKDWSGALWNLMLSLLDKGMSKEDVFWICSSAACNKYKRDGLSEEHLWADVCRAYIQHAQKVNTIIIPETHVVDLISDEELARVKARPTFVERYIEWASGLGDAATQYHQAGAFTILSALLAGRVVLPTSFGTMLPNLWFMILADTTLTRKSTAMDISIDLLMEVDGDAVMTTDGSIEGLMQGLSTRPSRPSIFLRDEFTGLLEAMTKKDYMAGMAETLTKLYDGKMQKRMLRKETVEVKKPVLIVFAGGIKAKTQSLLTLEHISSGFMPRFVFLTAESDTSRVQPMGPPVVRDMSGREALLEEMRDMYNHYSQPPRVDRGIPLGTQTWNAALTPEAWLRFNKFESALMEAGVKSDRADILTPVYDRLGKSALKCAVLLAASRQLGDKVEVTEDDIVHAISYARAWRDYAIEVINGVGRSAVESDIDKMLAVIRRYPNGVNRSALMQKFHLTAKTADAIFMTMEQRNLVMKTNYGRGTLYTAVPETPLEKV